MKNNYIVVIWFCLLLVLLTLSACSSRTQVHIFARNLDEEQVESIRAALAKQPLDLHVNKLALPFNMSQSSLIYSPLLASTEDIEPLLESLSQLGWPIQSVSPLASDNHRFTKDTIGVYLIPENSQSGTYTSVSDLAHQFNAHHCQSSAQITFNSDMTYKITTNQASKEKNPQALSGQWQVRNFPIIELRPTNAEWFLYFEITRNIVRDKISEIDMITLSPLDNYAAIEKCQFQYGERI